MAKSDAGAVNPMKSCVGQTQPHMWMVRLAIPRSRNKDSEI